VTGVYVGFPLFQKLDYGYYDNGAVETFKNDGFGSHEDDIYWYDLNNRIQQVWRNLVPIEAFTYDDLGNIVSKLGVTGTYSYSANEMPHAVTTIGDTDYYHDAVGNQLARIGSLVTGSYQTLTYNGFNMPSQITTGTNSAAVTTSLAYDAFHQRVAKTDAGAETIYVGDLYERTDPTASGEPTIHKYYVKAGRRIAMIVKHEASGATTPFSTTYFHPDRLGSPEAITNLTGAPTHKSFDAFGKPNPGMSEEMLVGFTGHLHDIDEGLINMKGRLYDPVIGRFITADPLELIGDGESLNRYSYVRNDPFNLVDPSGFQCQWVDNADGSGGRSYVCTGDDDGGGGGGGGGDGGGGGGKDGKTCGLINWVGYGFGFGDTCSNGLQSDYWSWAPKGASAIASAAGAVQCFFGGTNSQCRAAPPPEASKPRGGGNQGGDGSNAPGGGPTESTATPSVPSPAETAAPCCHERDPSW
jgi:RHS repeat-associated protein